MLSVDYDRPLIINPEQKFIFTLKIALMGVQTEAERCAQAINDQINGKVENIFNEINNNAPCSAIYPPATRTLSRQSDWRCVSELYQYDANQHLCVLSVHSSASIERPASSLSDNYPEVVIQTVPPLEPPATTPQTTIYPTDILMVLPQEPPPTTLQSTVYPTGTITTTVPSSTSTEIQTTTPSDEIFVEQDQTPFFVTEVNLTFESQGLTDECEEKLEEDIREVVNQASDIISQSLRYFPSCRHITDAELIPTKSVLSHGATSSLNQILLMVPFVLRSRAFSLNDMENCINHSVKPFLGEGGEGFQNNISNLINAIPGNICRKIDFVNSRYVVNIRCPSPFVFHHKARRCYRSPLIYMPTRVYKIQVTFSVSSARLRQCNASYQRSIRRQLERQQVNILREKMYDMCLRHDTVVTIHKSISPLKYRENGLTTELIGNVSVLLMATSEEPDYGGCAGTTLHQHLWSTDFIPGTLVVPTDEPRECGNVTWEKNDVVHMENTCLDSYLYYDKLNRCIDDRSAVLQARLLSNITSTSSPSLMCLSNVRKQLLGYMKAVIARVANSSQCSQMYQRVEAAVENDQIKINLSILPYHWNSSRTQECLKLIYSDMDQVRKRNFSHDLSPSCPDMHYRELNLTHLSYQCTALGYLWNETRYSCVRQQGSGKRKRRSVSSRYRRSQIMWTPTQPKGSNSLKGSRKPRQKRSVAQNASSEVTASWLPATPECQDQQPPVFVSCPRNITVVMGRKGPVPFNFTVPRATDNSGVPPTMGYYPADISRQPYLFKGQQRVTITATDQSNNTEVCSIPLLPVDRVPPDMTCPDTVVVEKYDTIYNQTNITISNGATAWDLSGLFGNHITYSRISNQFSEGAVPLRHFVNVTATAYDVHGNKGSCDFLYEAKRADMNAEGNVVLNFTVNVADPRRNCTDNISKLISYDVLNIANNSCIKNAEIYLGYVLYGNVISMDSLVLTLVVTQLKVHRQKFFQCMDNFTQGMVERYQSGSFIGNPDCGEVNITLNASKTAITCPLDSVLNETSLTCVQCDLGYYADQNKHSCERCPSVESGRIISGDCQLCDSEHHVSCLKPCQAGEYSENGLQPCIKCPQGLYTDQQGAKSCVRCPNNLSTEKTGAASSTQCKAICPPGQYSQTGLDTESGPCIDCPWNRYSSTLMSTDCSICPQGHATEGVGKSSLADCKVTDFCGVTPNPCQNGGTCLPNHIDNWYSCACPTGYYGYQCEHLYSVCDSDPCMNGGTCGVLNDRPVCHCPAGYTGDRCEFPLSPCSCVYGVCRSGEAGYHCSCFEGFTGLNCSEDIDDCSPNPCRHGGRCLNLIGQYQCDCSGTGYRGANCTELEPETTVTCFNGGIYMSGKCTCVPGYTGSQCELGINECEDDFCGEHGVCIDGVHNFSCVCKPGFTGKDCTNNTDECLASPCLNSARCIPGNNDFSCRCPPGFEGKRCEINRDECTPFPCNLTTALDCIDGNNDYTCVCRSGWTGKWCEQWTDTCPFQCQNAGSCNASAGRCDCQPGYTGVYCEVALDECARMPCLNGGTCTDEENGFKCSCPAGFTNMTCNVNVDDCSLRPCRNGGTCYDLVNDFACSCLPGWTGTNCEHKISSCLSLPCQNNGTCVDSTSGYYCICAYGYTGHNCSEKILTCDSSPCKNGASCSDTSGGYVCNCTSGYTGKRCGVKVDPCLSHNVCQNGAACQNGSCACSPFFTGFDCGKDKSSDFDLFFRGLNGSSTATSIPVEGGMSLCLWVRSFNTGQNKTILTLAINGTLPEKVLEIREHNFSVSAKDRSDSWNLNNALWNHVCFTWTQMNVGAWSLYLNGSKVAGDNQLNLPNSVEMLMGQPLQPVPGQVQFYGEVSQLQVFPSQLEPSYISNLSKSCSPVPGTSRAWLELRANVRGDLEVNEPSICGGVRCPAGYKGHDCSIQIDKSPPVVTRCPSNFRVVSSNRLSLVNWTEPTFYDDVGVVNVVQTHRSGEVLAYGEYVIMYVAFDAANNTGNCTFRVAVTPFDCEVPPVPEGVNHSCQTRDSETYCRLSCENPATHAFSESVPEFYKCGLSGQWDPPRGENFTFPACAAFFPPAAGVTGTISFAGPTCTEDLRLSLNQIFDQVMSKWNQEFKLCPDQVCNMQVQIHCSGDASRRRRRRQAVDTSYLVRFNFPVDKTSLETTSLQPLDSIKTFVKKGEFNSNGFVAQNDSVILTTQCNCSDGQELKHTGTTEYCVNCAVGSFQNQIRNPGVCELCPVGFYNDREKQTACTSCPPGKTSQDPGSTSLSQCYTVCPAGQYAEDVTNVCKKCPRGYYQNSAGSRMCQSCPNGQMTLEEGATSEQSCQPGCLAGKELSVSGVCKPCYEGFYKGDTTQASCQPCPYGTTTPGTGSSSVDQCSIVVCAEGSYTANNRCFPCSLGQYQPARGQTRCLRCAPGQTTLREGSRSPSDCVEGNVNECVTGGAQCGRNEKCRDTPLSYECDCEKGYERHNGTCLSNQQPLQQDDSAGVIIGATLGAGAIVIFIVVGICLARTCRKKEKEGLEHEGPLYRDMPVVVLPGGPAPVFQNRIYGSSRSSSLSLPGSDMMLTPTEEDMLPYFCPDESLNISDSSENGSSQGGQSASSGFDVDSDSYF